ncbi:ribosomal protein L4 [Sporormia fimetaria CBS 119925]|uniref:Large ribosomal subunit protein uL4m n=1 Tax=Sporormia fimetaria CBS 119925 TaxID=1340428 RepID=A0A6A6VE37_9PLEO|nr:ribosomal protein L4 [Sporormia fimetaria CBS 119925]
MASTRISAPVRGVTLQLSRLSLRSHASHTPARASFVRSISTSPSSYAAVSSLPPPPAPNTTVVPIEERTVTATVHHFPSLEPLRLETFPANHLALPTRRDILHRAVIYEADRSRGPQRDGWGSASAKYRSEVHGSARKIRPQKGTGHARQGDKKAPHMRGGGAAHGPKPRDFSSGLQRKVYDLAFRTALSYRFRKGELLIVDNAMEIEFPSPRFAQHLFNENSWGKKHGRSVLVTVEDRPFLQRALQDVPALGWTAPWDDVDVKDLLSTQRIIIEHQALRNILLSHQTDITRSTFRPKLVDTLEPTELTDNVGWTEFRELELADPEEREAIKPGIYWQVGELRLAEAAELPDTHVDLCAELQHSAYNLKAEARRMEAEALEAGHEKEDEKSADPDVAIPALQKGIQIARLRAEQADFAAEAIECSSAVEEDAELKAAAIQEAEELRGDASKWDEVVVELQSELEAFSGEQQELVE